MAASAPIKVLKAPPLPAPLGRRPIGFRGNHQHKKALYDPVYRTTRVPSNLVPRYPIDWRNGGRALLVAALHKLEGNYPLLLQQPQLLLQQQRPLSPGALMASEDGSVGCSSTAGMAAVGRHSARAGAAASATAKCFVLRHRRSLQWQEGGFCTSRCGSTCSKSSWRCLCAWRCRGLHQHINRMDSILMSYKGPSFSGKPLFAVKRPEAVPSRVASEGMVFCNASGGFVRMCKKMHPAFEHLDSAEQIRKMDTPNGTTYGGRAECWGWDDDLGIDSDADDEADEEADSLARFLLAAGNTCS